MPGISLLPAEIIHLILLDIEYTDILNYCHIDKETQFICDNTLFWKYKLNYDFAQNIGGSPSNYVTKYLLLDTEWCNTYMRWRDFNIDEYTNLDLIIYNMDIGYELDTIQKRLLLGAVISKCSLSIIQELYGRGILCFKSWIEYQYLVTRVVNYDRIDILIWLYENGVISDDRYGIEAANAAIQTNNINILDWLAERGYLPDCFSIGDTSTKYTCTDLIHWLEKHNLMMPHTMIGAAIISGKIHQLHLLYEKGFIPDHIDVTLTITSNSPNTISILEWFESKNIYPTSADADFTLYYRKFHELEWMVTRNIFPTNQKIIQIMNSNDHVCKAWVINNIKS